MKSTLILIALGALALTACRKDNVDPALPVQLIISKNPLDVDKTIYLNYNHPSNQVQIGFLNLRADGATVALDQLPVTLSINNTTGYYYGNGTILTNVYLYDLNNNLLDEEALTTTNGVGQVTFINLRFKVTNQSTSLIIKGDITAPQFVYSNTFIQASITGKNIDGIIAYNNKTKLVNTLDKQQVLSLYVGAATQLTY